MKVRILVNRIPVLLIGLTGCSGDGGTAGIEGSSTAASGGTAGESSGVTSGADSASSMPLGMSETGVGEVDPCEDPQVIPPPPVDCSAADGVIEGSVLIEDGGDDPSILEGVVRVEGALRINRTALINLDFMACLQEVGGDVTIFGNEQLTDVDGLWSLTTIGTDFVFSQNDAIEVFDGLPNVSVIPGSVVIRENASLLRIDGFHSLVELEGLGEDPETGEPIGGQLVIQANPMLERIDGLLGLRVIHGAITTTANPVLCLSSVYSVVECMEEAPPLSSWCMVEPEGCGDLDC